MKLHSKYRFIGTLALIILAVNTYSQEKQVPFFPDEEVGTIDRNYAKKMSFFSDYEGFSEARLFQIPDGKFAMEIFYERDGDLFKERLVMTEAEKDAYLNNMKREYAIQAGIITEDELQDEGEGEAGSEEFNQITLLNQKGRTPMLVMNTIAGLGYYGYAVPLMFNVDDERAFVGLYMLTAGASFYLPYRITQNKNVTLAQASLNFYGISRGGLHGGALGELLTKNPSMDDFFDYENATGDYWSSPEFQQAQDDYDQALKKRNSTLFGMSIAGSVAGGIAGFKLAERWDYDGGSTSILQMWGDVGMISGFLASDVLNLYERPEIDAVFGTTMLTSFAGMYAGKLFGDSRNYTLGDAIVYRSTIALSALPILTMVDYFDPEDETPYTIGGLLGIAAGSYLGWKATLDRDFSTGDGVFIALGELAGGLVGLGAGFLISADSESQLLLTTATLGALGGYGLMYSTLKENAAPKMAGLDIQLRFNPAGLVMNRFSRPVSPAMMGMYNIGSLQLRF